MVGYALLLIIAMSLVAYFVGRTAGAGMMRTAGRAMHSLPGYHGALVAIWVGIPCLVLVLLWAALQETVVIGLLLETLPPAMTEGISADQRALLITNIKNVASGVLFGTPAPEISAAAERYTAWSRIAELALLVVVLAVAIIAIAVVRSRLAPRFRARNAFERTVSGIMIFCATVAILTTVGIVASLIYESWAFFSIVPLHEFLFGLSWEPQIPIREGQVAASGAFGAVPVFVGTILIAAIAMAVAIPIGLFSAIYLTEYASNRTRAVVKPILEILAGVPTVVYGFFAILTVAPAIRDFGGLLGIAVSPNSALAAGLVMGIMIVPFISSLSDDALNAVPRAMRDGSLALGATRGETMTKVLLPAAIPGIVGGILLGLSRAIGETMIVVMAAGIIASLTFDPIDSVTTVTVQIVTLLIGDTAFDNPKTLSAFALGLVLFICTLGLNVAAIRIVQKYREQYD